jgi:chromosome segregation ATPase
MNDDEQLDARIEALEAEERDVSARRRKLHDRLASFPNEVTLQQEREISGRRRELHAEIDALRAERSRRREQHGAVDG